MDFAMIFNVCFFLFKKRNHKRNLAKLAGVGVDISARLFVLTTDHMLGKGPNE